MIGGLDLFDAINHALTTMATGGFSTKNESMAAFSPFVQYVTIFFMVLAGTSFTLNYFLLKGRFEKILQNDEFKFYLSVLALFSLAITLILWVGNSLDLENAFRDSLFQVVSIATTTGFITTDYLNWGGSLWFLIFLLMFTGGCIGSTAGGIKMIRHLVLLKNMRLEFKRLIHPMAVIPIRVSGRTIPQDIIQNFLAFFMIYITCIAIGSAVMAFLGLDFVSAIGATVSSIGNIGPAIGNLGPTDNYAWIPDAGKWVLSFLMLAGRLELFTVFLIFSPSFYKN
jgi:trk system potassium uptake protein TrkH